MSEYSNSTNEGSPYNAFGYDPSGLIAHICHWFFGPEWQPRTQDHLKGLPVSGQPRYGPPAPSQLDQLPTSFTPQPPPLYFGEPTPPYIDGPLDFDPRVFAQFADIMTVAKESSDPSQALCYKKVHGTEVMNGVYRLDVKLVHSHRCDRMSILSNIPWPSLHSRIRERLGTKCKPLELLYNIHDSWFRFELGLTPLREEEDWANAMAIMSNGFGRCEELEIEIRHKVNANLDEDTNEQPPRPEGPLDVETFYFEYPSLEALAGFIRSKYPEEDLKESQYHLVRANGIEYLDDFTLVSATKLHLWAGIPMHQIRKLYRYAEEMMKDFHREKRKDIEEIQEFRSSTYK